MGEIKDFGLGGVLKLPKGVSYVPRGRNSSYFDFIPTFRLNWDCFEANFGFSLVLFFVQCYGMFCGFNSDGFGGRFCGFTWDGFRACLRSCFGSKFGVQYLPILFSGMLLSGLQNCSLGYEIAWVLAQAAFVILM